MLGIVLLLHLQYECSTSINQNLYNYRRSSLWIFAKLAKVQWTLANMSHGNSPIGESSVDFRQYVPWKLANWRKFSGLSAICPMEIRQLLAKILLAKFRNPDVTQKGVRVSVNIV